MTNHQKRLSVPRSWPVERKTDTFTVKADAGPHGEAGVPLVILLRDVLGYVDSTKEARYAINQGTILVNGTAAGDHERPIGMFDILVFTEREEYYRVFPDEGGRLTLTPIDADAAGSRLGKIVGKQQVPGGDTQLTLHDGATLQLSDAAEYGGGDSIVVDNETGEIVAHFPYEAGAMVTAVDGAHAGEIGEIEEIVVTPGSGSNDVVVSQPDGSFSTIADYVVVIDENFVDDDHRLATDEPDADREDPVAEEADEADESDVTDEADEADESDVTDEADEADESDVADEADEVDAADAEESDDEATTDEAESGADTDAADAEGGDET